MATPTKVPQTAPAAAAAAQLPELPEAAVSCILQHVPLRQRLNSCALVCRAWAAAASAAPADVDVSFENSEQRQQLQHWLDKHGAVVEGLRVDDKDFLDGEHTLQLPVLQLTRLRSLGLGHWHSSGFGVQLPARVATGVTRRSIGRRSRSALLTGPSGTTAVGSIGSATAVLPQLQELTLSKCHLTMQLLSQLLSATALSKLQWESPLVCGDSSVSGLLKDREVYSALWQGLQPLPKLSELRLSGRKLTAADIAPLSTLQRLQRLDLNVDYMVGGSMAAELLSALQHLTQLQHLALRGVGLYRVGAQQEPGSSYQCFSALTASTQLTALYLKDIRQPVPKAAFRHMLPSGHVLPHLKELTVIRGSSLYSATAPPVEAAHVAMIAASCPALHELTLQDATPDDFDVSCLAQLPSGVTKVEGLEWTRPMP